MAGVGWTRTHCQINRLTPLEAQPAMDSLWHHSPPFKVTLGAVGARASWGLDNTKQKLLRELGYDPWCVVGGMRQLSPPNCVRSIPHTPYAQLAQLARLCTMFQLCAILTSWRSWRT